MFLTGLLTACGSQPTVLTDPEIIYRDRPVPVQVPADLLAPCEVTPLPEPGDDVRWVDILVLAKTKDTEQIACNKRFENIREWMTAEHEDRE